MKNLKQLLLLFVAIIAMATSVTSCIENNDDTLDYATQQKYLSDMAGTYFGKARFYYPKSDAYATNLQYVKYDSLETEWRTRAADSSFVINRFPVYMLDSAVVVDKNASGDEAEKYRALNQAIRDLRNTEPYGTLNAKFAIPSSSWISGSVYQFLFQPQTIEVSLDFNGENHNVWFVFEQSYGAFSGSQRVYQAQANLYGICIDKLELRSQYMVPSQYLKKVVVTFAQ